MMQHPMNQDRPPRTKEHSRVLHPTLYTFISALAEIFLYYLSCRRCLCSIFFLPKKMARRDRRAVQPESGQDYFLSDSFMKYFLRLE
jgi:hypothetical protein